METFTQDFGCSIAEEAFKMGCGTCHAAIQLVTTLLIKCFKIDLDEQNHLGLLALVAINRVKKDIAILSNLTSFAVISPSKSLQVIASNSVQVGESRILHPSEADDGNILFSEPLGKQGIKTVTNLLEQFLFIPMRMKFWTSPV